MPGKNMKLVTLETIAHLCSLVDNCPQYSQAVFTLTYLCSHFNSCCLAMTSVGSGFGLFLSKFFKQETFNLFYLQSMYIAFLLYFSLCVYILYKNKNKKNLELLKESDYRQKLYQLVPSALLCAWNPLLESAI